MTKSIAVVAAATLIGIVCVCALANSRAASSDPSQPTSDATIDTWQLHLNADVERLPVTTVADLG